MKLFLAVATFVAIASTQGDDVIPGCAENCFLAGFSKVSCEISDIQCGCNKFNDLVPIMLPCVQSACSNEDVGKVLYLVDQACKNGDVIKVRGLAAATDPVPAANVIVVDTGPTGYPVGSSLAPSPTSSSGPEESSDVPSSLPCESTTTTVTLTFTVTEVSQSLYSTFAPSLNSTGTLDASDTSPGTNLPSPTSAAPFEPTQILPPYPTGSPQLTATHPSASVSYTPSSIDFPGAAEPTTVPVVFVGLLGMIAWVL